MFLNISGVTQQYLADLEQNQLDLQQATAQISSGTRVRQPGDDPSAISEILQIQSEISANQQVQSNLGSAKTEVDTADSALQTAVQAVESAISLAAQGASSTMTADGRASIAQQVAALQQTLVGISQTTVAGHYIFSGDQDTQPSYELDATQATGVKQLITPTSTRVIQSVDGTSFAIAKTAQEIFDARNADGTTAAGNVFAAINSLLTALNNNDQTGIATAADSLKTADSYLNNQAAFYGSVQNRIQEATGLAQKFQTQQRTELSQVRDTDVASVATQLTQLQVQQQASMSVEASVLQQKNLFSYLA